jgi:2-polyprenyl-6-methoxyphenol hydroxylase-like FAD-dependent oxidoreductase
MTPNLGQGACQAIEDALVLALCLRADPNVDSALTAYESRRQPRTRAIVLQSRRFGQLAQWENRPLCWLRNAALRVTPPSVGERRMKEQLGFELLTAAERRMFS